MKLFVKWNFKVSMATLFTLNVMSKCISSV